MTQLTRPIATQLRHRLLSPSLRGKKRSVITPTILAQRWGIGLSAAKRTLENTTQEGVRNIFIPSERKTRLKAPWMNFPSIKGKFYTDQMFSKVKSMHGDIGGTIFTDGGGYDRFYPWGQNRTAGRARDHLRAR